MKSKKLVVQLLAPVPDDVLPNLDHLRVDLEGLVAEYTTGIPESLVYGVKVVDDEVEAERAQIVHEQRMEAVRRLRNAWAQYVEEFWEGTPHEVGLWEELRNDLATLGMTQDEWIEATR